MPLSCEGRERGQDTSRNAWHCYLFVRTSLSLDEPAPSAPKGRRRERLAGVNWSGGGGNEHMSKGEQPLMLEPI